MGIHTKLEATMDELPGIHNLSLRTWVNGELRQDGSTSELVYRFGEMIEELTTGATPFRWTGNTSLCGLDLQ